jgi:hypothetical protein
VAPPGPLVRRAPATSSTTSATPRVTAPRAAAHAVRSAGEFGLETH